MDPEEDPDRSILWKIGRMKDNEDDEELAEIYGRIVRFFFPFFTLLFHVEFKSSP